MMLPDPWFWLGFAFGWFIGWRFDLAARGRRLYVDLKRWWRERK